MDRFILCFKVTKRSLELALAQKTGKGILPLSGYYSWPVRDAWEDMKIAIKAQKWISANDSVSLLNQYTEVINYWQEGDPIVKRDVNNLKERFPNSKYPNLFFFGRRKRK